MSNPYLTAFKSTASTKVKVNNISPDIFGEIDVPLKSLTDVNIQDQTLANGELLIYNNDKWTPYTLLGASFNDTNKTITISAGSSSLSGCRDVSVTNPSNNQLLVFTNFSSLNKWTPYTLLGATFNDTNKTITISPGSSSLSTLTDCTITTPVTGNLLIYDGTASKWKNSDSIPDNLLFMYDDGNNTRKMQFQLSSITAGQTRILTVPDYSGTIAVSTNSQTSNYALISNGTSPRWQPITTTIVNDIQLSPQQNNDILLYNLSTAKFVNSQLFNILYNNSTVIASSVKTFGDYPTGTAIVNNGYYTTSSYLDNTDDNILTKYVSSITNINISQLINSPTQGYGNATINSGYKAVYGIGYEPSNKYRLNIDFGTTYTITQIVNYANLYYSTIKVYGTNAVSEYNDITTLTGLDTNPNLVFLCSITGNATYASADQTTAFRYTVVSIIMTQSYGYSLTVSFKTGGYTTSYLVNSTTNPSTYGYIIDSDPTSGYPRFQNKTGSNLGGTYNRFTLLYSEMYRRMYPVIRDKNTIVLTDSGSNTITLSSTLGYPLSKASDVTITTPSNGHLLKYSTSSNKWINVPSTLNSNFFSDTNITSITDKNALQYSEFYGKWINVPSTLNSNFFSDTNITSIADKNVLQYSGFYGKWINVPSSLNSNFFSDTNIVSAAHGNILTYDSSTSKWINSNFLTDSLLFINDDLDGTKKLQFQLSGITSGQTRTLTVPDASCVIVGDTNTQTLTNKTLTDPTNNIMANSLKSATTTIDISNAIAPSVGQVLTATSATTATWQTVTAAVPDLFSIDIVTDYYLKDGEYLNDLSPEFDAHVVDLEYVLDDKYRVVLPSTGLHHGQKIYIQANSYGTNYLFVSASGICICFGIGEFTMGSTVSQPSTTLCFTYYTSGNPWNTYNKPYPNWKSETLASNLIPIPSTVNSVILKSKPVSIPFSFYASIHQINKQSIEFVDLGNSLNYTSCVIDANDIGCTFLSNSAHQYTMNSVNVVYKFLRFNGNILSIKYNDSL